MPDSPKISVIIAAYRSGDRIRRVLDSLDAQTLPQAEFETIVVDDGSPDDTFELLTALAADRPNMRIDRIENTGWASGPRNHGIEMARGEWVLFMDHDDALYPDALRRGAEFAAEHRSDIVSAKEVKSNNLGWGFSGYLENIGNAVPDRGITALLPMLPHKLYRRAMLLEHDVRFPVGRRMLWEDVYFNVAAYRAAEVVSVLADTPFYLWTIAGGNNSSTYGPGSPEYWQRMIDLMTYIDETLDGERFAASRRAMLVQQYRVRVVGRFHPLLQVADDPRLPMAMPFVREILDRFLPVEWDADLGVLDRAKSFLLRAGRIDLLRQLHLAQSAVAGQATADTIEWRGDRLHLTATVRWRTVDGDPLLLQRDGDRLLRRLPRAVQRELPEALLDLAGEVHGATALVTVQNRGGREAWAQATTVVPAIEEVGRGLVTPTLRIETVIDPATAGYGRPLAETTWDVHVRVTLSDVVNHRALKTTTAALPAVVHGRPVAVYANTRDALSLDLASRLRSVVKDGRPPLADVTGTVAGLVVPLPAVHVGTGGAVPAQLVLRTADTVAGTLDGRLVADEHGARLELAGDVPAGTYGVEVALGDAEPLPTRWRLQVDHRGLVELSRIATPPAASDGRSGPSLRDRLVRGVRRSGRRLLRRV
jgi:glycosyltransferase involved in cell wall biosynthesis